jgi:DNA-binding MarR family transcriptional regulator
LTAQVLRHETTSGAAADRVWAALLHAHAGATRELGADLHARHGLTLSDYETLAVLAEGPVRRVDLAQRLGLTASGVTRLLDGLEEAGLVARAACPSDRRVTYAVLTGTGAAKLAEAAGCHARAVREYLAARLAADELAQLAALLERL